MTDQNPKSAIATRDSWREIQPMPEKKSRLAFERSFSQREFQRLIKGVIPEVMEDKWFVFFEDNWLYFHRSWTGACIYQVRLVPNGEKYEVAEAWVNRKEYKSFSNAYDALLLSFLINNLLLGKTTPFPVPEDLPNDLPEGAYQHNVSGSAYPEVEIKEKDKS